MSRSSTSCCVNNCKNSLKSGGRIAVTFGHAPIDLDAATTLCVRSQQPMLHIARLIMCGVGGALAVENAIILLVNWKSDWPNRHRAELAGLVIGERLVSAQFGALAQVGWKNRRPG
jgi:hypothetical protein